MKKIKKKQEREKVKKQIQDFFKSANEKTPEKQVKQIKKLAMHYNIKLGDLRKRFCKKCFSIFALGKNCQIRIKKGEKVITCRNCKSVNRWNIKTS